MTYKHKHRVSGFTMIELLMVIMIIAILGAAALPQFLDFRNEARAASVQQMLSTMRVGIKNQIQQSLLKCGIEGDLTTPRFTGLSYNHILGENVYWNDITLTSTYGTPSVICSAAHLPNPEDRKFWDAMSDDQRAHYVLGSDYGPNGYFYKNPFAASGSVIEFPMVTVSDADITSSGGKCGTSDLYLGMGAVVHWIYNQDTAEIFAGTNTAGINECSF